MLEALHEQARDIAVTLPVLKETLRRNQADLEQLEKRLLKSRVDIRQELSALEKHKLAAVRAATMESFRAVMEDEIGIIPDQVGYRLNDEINVIFEKHCQRCTDWTSQLEGAFRLEYEKQDEMVQSLVSKGAGALRGANLIGVDGFKRGIFAGRDLLSKVGPTIKFKPWQVTKMANFATKALPLIGAGISLALDITSAARARKLQREFEKNKNDLNASIADMFKKANDGLNDDCEFISSFAQNYEVLVGQIQSDVALIAQQETMLAEFAEWERNLTAADLRVGTAG